MVVSGLFYMRIKAGRHGVKKTTCGDQTSTSAAVFRNFQNTLNGYRVTIDSDPAGITNDTRADCHGSLTGLRQLTVAIV